MPDAPRFHKGDSVILRTSHEMGVVCKPRLFAKRPTESAVSYLQCTSAVNTPVVGSSVAVARHRRGLWADI